MAGNLLVGISQDEHERAVFRSRRMYQTDLASDLATAEDRGEKRGRMEGKMEVARKLLSMGLPIRQIASATDLAESDIRGLLS